MMGSRNELRSSTRLLELLRRGLCWLTSRGFSSSGSFWTLSVSIISPSLLVDGSGLKHLTLLCITQVLSCTVHVELHVLFCDGHVPFPAQQGWCMLLLWLHLSVWVSLSSTKLPSLLSWTNQISSLEWKHETKSSQTINQTFKLAILEGNLNISSTIILR